MTVALIAGVTGRDGTYLAEQMAAQFVVAASINNQASPRRPASFITRKITREAAAIARGRLSTMGLGIWTGNATGGTLPIIRGPGG